jgi:glutamate racemase
VPLAEEGLWNDKITAAAAKKYLIPLKNKSVDTVILACTHYPIIQKTIARTMGSNVKLINSADAVTKKVKQVLHSKKLLNSQTIGVIASPSTSSGRGNLSNKKPKIIFYSSDSPKDFKIFAQKILKKPVKVYLKNLNG